MRALHLLFSINLIFGGILCSQATQPEPPPCPFALGWYYPLMGTNPCTWGPPLGVPWLPSDMYTDLPQLPGQAWNEGYWVPGGECVTFSTSAVTDLDYCLTDFGDPCQYWYTQTPILDDVEIWSSGLIAEYTLLTHYGQEIFAVYENLGSCLAPDGPRAGLPVRTALTVIARCDLAGGGGEAGFGYHDKRCPGTVEDGITSIYHVRYVTGIAMYPQLVTPVVGYGTPPLNCGGYLTGPTATSMSFAMQARARDFPGSIGMTENSCQADARAVSAVRLVSYSYPNLEEEVLGTLTVAGAMDGRIRVDGHLPSDGTTFSIGGSVNAVVFSFGIGIPITFGDCDTEWNAGGGVLLSINNQQAQPFQIEEGLRTYTEDSGCEGELIVHRETPIETYASNLSVTTGSSSSGVPVGIAGGVKAIAYGAWDGNDPLNITAQVDLTAGISDFIWEPMYFTCVQ